MAIKIGLDAALFYSIGGVDTPIWVELTNVKDVTLNLEAGEADITTRANSGWRATLATLKEGSVEFEMLWDTADVGFTAIKDAFFTGAVIGFQVFDAATAGSGLQADFTITSFNRAEPLEEAITVSITAKVSYVATAPIWI